MEVNLDSLLSKLDVPTLKLQSQILQDILTSMKKVSQNEDYLNTIDKILDRLWAHLTIILPTFDDQLLCSTCFYTVLMYSKNQEKYLQEVSTILHDYISIDENHSQSNNFSLEISLMYGIFQSSYLTQEKHIGESSGIICNIIKLIYRILLLKAYDYSQYTFIVFKTISSFKKVIGTSFQQSIYNRSNQINLLNAINHNWENPITGIRNLNRTIFHTLISIADQDIYIQIIKEINTFYWNKAKYLMLTEIIEQSQSNIHTLLQDKDWINGIFYSLYKPGLVSAGSDMYYAVLKKINTDDEWCAIFLKKLLKLFVGQSQKAIENFYNYWCLISLKKFPTLMEKFINEVNKMEYPKQQLLCCLCIMKQGNKIGLLDKDYGMSDQNQVMNYIYEGLNHCNTHVRIMAFDVVCVLHGKYSPTKYEYDLILNYLYNNVNSDCTVLRINLINSLSSFLVHLQHIYLLTIENDNVQEMENFCIKLQHFIIKSINIDGNYQRKIATIKIIDLVFKHFNSIPSKKQSSKKGKREVLMEMLKNNNIWLLSERDFILKLIFLLKDPADDVRDNILQVLLNYYIDDLNSTDLLSVLIEDAFKCTQSKFFYDIECGRIIFKLIIKIILKEKQILGRFKKVEDVYDYWYNELDHEIRLQRNVVDSITAGKQLYSIIGILSIIYASCLETGYKLNIKEDSSLVLIKILDNVSNQFMGDEEATVSFDFSKMSDMVENYIKTSKFSPQENDEAKISGLHQIVLSCLWLNVKASCELASLLLAYNIEDEGTCEKCLNIITHVLETCRHKGAIEAAGATLGKSIQHLSSLPPQYKASQLPFKLLEKKLKELIFEANVMASVTRRGAGLSIMIHRIVSSDMKKGKPLFHYFINALLKVCAETSDTLIEKECNDKEQDLPKAIFIHFLTKIVTDSSLASEMMYYSAKLAKLAFENLTSPHWQIRNAALQLYGALVPKLIGQKKASGVDEETVATVGCDEFRTHSSKLWSFILTKLKQITYCVDIQEQSNLVPILNILANIAKRYNFSYDLKVQRHNDLQLLECLKICLGSPIYTVRRLVSRCIINIYSFIEIYQLLVEYKYISENSLHGILMLMDELFKIYKDSPKSDVMALRQKYNLILQSRQHSYLNRVIFERIFISEDLIQIDDSISQVCLEVSKNKHLPGAFVWANFRIKYFIENTTWDMLARYFLTILDFSDLESHTEIICQKLEEDLHLAAQPLSQIAYTLISSSKAISSYEIWKFVYILSKKIELNVQISTDTFRKLLNKKFCTRYFIPFAARICGKNLQVDDIRKISHVIFELCDPGNYDTDMRTISALANNELTSVFPNLPDDVKIHAINSAIILLQDEDENIRNLSTDFYLHLTNDNSKHPFMCINYILNRTFLETVLNRPDQGIKDIKKDLTQFLSSLIILDKDSYNPFANESKNIYLEINVLKQLLDNL
ncbi:uncharacterized protein LOC119832835 [Zerene cesonia]|uniref:uncharacterized protein LOC119832835 n=1 Tax=Zerene cesonia TaxID=33412 RepID=UPI0018E55CF3|nr:uncharacterized protein LOC119832835 [Zerene cesonia]